MKRVYAAVAGGVALAFVLTTTTVFTQQNTTPPRQWWVNKDKGGQYGKHKPHIKLAD
jgi:hypothetical protein